MKKLIVTGAAGLIGCEVCLYFHQLGWQIHGIDNNQRAVFFGPKGDNTINKKRLQQSLTNYYHYSVDIRNREKIIELIQEIQPDAIVHTAAQPSHDRAASIPFEDFDVNAVGTINLLEATRRYSIEVPFVHLSTNKIYGDKPNQLLLKELSTRWEFADAKYKNGIKENFGIDQSKHSLFGASKVAADIYVQEYGRYFNMPTVCLRGGCLTGPNHSGVELHGFLSYLIKCNLEERPYTIFGYKGKQVRDNIHAIDVVKFIEAYLYNPRVGEVYNIGGGKENTCSIIEAFDMVETISKKKMIYSYDEQHRIGDHICYYSDLNKIKKHYPNWNITKSLPTIFEEIYFSWIKKPQYQ